MEEHRLRCRLFWVDVRVRRFGDRWIASAETPDGPTLGTAGSRPAAVRAALEPFADIRDELLGSFDWATSD